MYFLMDSLFVGCPMNHLPKGKATNGGDGEMSPKEEVVGPEMDGNCWMGCYDLVKRLRENSSE